MRFVPGYRRGLVSKASDGNPASDAQGVGKDVGFGEAMSYIGTEYESLHSREAESRETPSTSVWRVATN